MARSAIPTRLDVNGAPRHVRQRLDRRRLDPLVRLDCDRRDRLRIDLRNKLAAEMLRRSEERFRGAFDAAAIGMALVAPDGRFLMVNPSLCQLLGYDESEFLELTFQDITHPEDLDLRLLRRLAVGEIPSYQMEKRYRHKDGRLVWVVLSVSLVRDAQDDPPVFRRSDQGHLGSEDGRGRTLESETPAAIHPGSDA